MVSSRSSSWTWPSIRSSGPTWDGPGPRRSSPPPGSRRSSARRSQIWYHWGELWLASLVVNLLGVTSLAARSFVVLPVLLLAAATLTGTLVRRVTGTTSRGAFVFGFLACLFLAPVPLLSGPFFGDWAVGLIFGITLYGLAAVAVLLAMYGLTVLTDRPPTWALAGFVGTTFALLLPAHLILALLAIVGVGAAVTVHAARSLRAARRLPAVSQLWRRTLIWSAVALVVTLVWGALTGHGVGGSGASAGVSPFNADVARHAGRCPCRRGCIPRDRSRLVPRPARGLPRGRAVRRRDRVARGRSARVGPAARRLQHVPRVLRRTRRVRHAGRGDRRVVAVDPAAGDRTAARWRSS